MKLLILSLSLAVGCQAASLNIDSWQLESGVKGSVPVTLSLIGHKGGATCWSRFPAIILTNDATLTVTCLLRFEPPPRDPSTAQIRLALQGAPAGADDLNALRGFILYGGLRRAQWETMLWERIAGAPKPCAMTNSVRLATALGPEKATADQAMRVVLSVRRREARTFDVSGFWGSHAFTFSGLKTEIDHTRFDCVSLLNGGASGITNLVIESCRVSGP